eukprot:jgi/Chlat1/8663/Chrsp87S08047
MLAAGACVSVAAAAAAAASGAPDEVCSFRVTGIFRWAVPAAAVANAPAHDLAAELVEDEFAARARNAPAARVKLRLDHVGAGMLATLRDGATAQVIGEVKDGAVWARVVRRCDGLDLSAYAQALALRQQFEAEFLQKCQSSSVREQYGAIG